MDSKKTGNDKSESEMGYVLNPTHRDKACDEMGTQSFVSGRLAPSAPAGTSRLQSLAMVR